VVHVRRRL